MNLLNITSNTIVEKFNKYLNRVICDLLRDGKSTCRHVSDIICSLDRPNNLYEVKLFVDTLDATLPEEDSVIGMDWYIKLRKNFKKWDTVLDSLNTEEYDDISIEDVVNLMICDNRRIEDLLNILEKADIK